MKNQINAIIEDQKSSFAHAFMMNESGYGHIYVKIRLKAEGEYAYRRPYGVLTVSCQIGSQSSSGNCDQLCATYAHRYGYEGGFEQADIAEMEQVVKMMRRIGRYMDKMYQEIGSPKNYADFCQRVLVGCGVKHLIVEPGQGWNTGGNLSNKDLIRVGPNSAYRLGNMEGELIAKFARKAA